MKYLVMIYGSEAAYNAMSGKPSEGNPAWSEQDLQAMFAHMEAINNDLAESGEVLDGAGLSAPSQARVVSAGRDGTQVVSDGPFGETKELLAGYWVLECESLDRVTEIAKRVHACPAPAGSKVTDVVIRQIMDTPPEA
ncbi:YciI family protein [Streptomyces sp. MP131-18]|uniref:YciI family protein n=1 Tax=Streptomyces sp. MP131-18 TaxID=1857892 RepID=UPI00097BE076|nr:YciI family protein [Streptomyces sp. MP131-18]ONK13391.1 YCII-related domain protein [Streptomyces sp. MP131-18]